MLRAVYITIKNISHVDLYNGCNMNSVLYTPMVGKHVVNPYPAKLIYLNFQPLEVVSRYRDPHLQVSENYSYWLN